MARQRSNTILDEVPQLRERLYTTLYRLRYGWQFRSSVEILKEAPIWVLGSFYHLGIEAGDRPRDIEGAPPHVLAFMEHYYSIPWMTYRSHFSPITGTSLTTDCGWGCMVRSGQMILASALNCHLLGKDWRLPNSTSQDRNTHQKILSWFADCPNPNAPFSLHALMDQAVRHDNRPGDWFGPSQVAVLIRECIRLAKTSVPELKDLQVYVAHDCTVYVNDVLELFASDPMKALFLLVPVRLGSEALNPIYIPCVQGLLSLDVCVGIIGGRPKHSVYFVGFQEDKLIHLDPHYCQTASILREEENHSNYDVKSYHCNTPRKISANKMDPSCTIGFYCRGLEQFHVLRNVTEKVLAPPKQKGVYPFFTFADMSIGETLDTSLDMQFGSVVSSSLQTHPDVFKASESRNTPSDEEDFVIVDCKASKSLSRDGLFSINTNGAVGGARNETHKDTATKPATAAVLTNQTTMRVPTVNNTDNANGVAEFDEEFGDFNKVAFDND